MFRPLDDSTTQPTERPPSQVKSCIVFIEDIHQSILSCVDDDDDDADTRRGSKKW